MQRTYSQMQRTDKCSEHSSIIWSVGPNGWVFIYELSGSAFKSSCYLGLRFWKAIFFHEITNILKARNTTIKIIYIIKLYILTPSFKFFYDILHCATPQNNFSPLCNVGKDQSAVGNSNYRPLVFCLCDSILCSSFSNQKIAECALK